MATSKTRRKGRPASPDKSGDEAIYAEAVARFRETHGLLAGLGEGRRVGRSERRQVWEALEDIRDKLSSREAKKAQLEATNGRPLTICFGTRRRRRLPELAVLWRAQRDDPDEEVTIIDWGLYGDGCGVIFRDSVTQSRPVFARYCKVCRDFSEPRRREDVLRRVAALWDGRLPVVGGWRLTCTGCGERFFSPTSQRRRCDRCRH